MSQINASGLLRICLLCSDLVQIVVEFVLEGRLIAIVVNNCESKQRSTCPRVKCEQSEAHKACVIPNERGEITWCCLCTLFGRRYTHCRLVIRARALLGGMKNSVRRLWVKSEVQTEMESKNTTSICQRKAHVNTTSDDEFQGGMVWCVRAKNICEKDLVAHEHKLEDVCKIAWCLHLPQSRLRCYHCCYHQSLLSLCVFVLQVSWVQVVFSRRSWQQPV
jgi:hypothetical protein